MMDVTNGPAVPLPGSPKPAIQHPDEILNFKDGARMLRFLPRGVIERRVVLFGRNNFTADDLFLIRLIDHFRQHAIVFDIFEAPLESVFARVGRQRILCRLPVLVQRAAKAILIAVNPRLWKHVQPHLRDETAYAKLRAESFVTALQQMQPKPSAAIGRSAGALAITRNAQALGLRALVCLGYPFRHPEQGDEPTRYAHLATLTTPCLIIQGERDPYGDSVSARQYALSPTTSLSFIDADHETSFSEETLQILLDRIVGFIHAH